MDVEEGSDQTFDLQNIDFCAYVIVPNSHVHASWPIDNPEAEFKRGIANSAIIISR